MGVAQYLVLAVAAQRLAEALWGERNAWRLMAEGGAEVGRRHYPLFVALHGAWLATLFIAVPPDAPVSWAWIGAYLVLQVGRLWAMATLGRAWTTRIVTLDAPLVATGPYRFLRHPNYLIVAGEIAVVPLVFGEWEIAILFSLLNAPLLAWRIRVEDKALSARRRRGGLGA